MMNRKELLIITLLVFLVCVFFWPVFLQEKVAMNANNLVSSYVPWRYEEHQGRAVAAYAKPGMLDQLRLYIPYLIFMREEFHAGRIPLWNPHNFSGSPLMAELQSAVFYPTNVLLLLLQVPDYWNFLIILGYALSVIFTYLYVRSLGFASPFAAFSGITFAFSGFMVAWSQEVLMAIHSIAWLPLLLLAADAFLARPDRKWWALFVLGCTMSLLSGYLQTSLYVFLFVLAYVLWKSKRISFRSSILLILGMAMAVLINAVQFLPAEELYKLSSRSIVDFRSVLSEYLLEASWLVTYIVPDFFGHPTTRNETVSFVGTYYERALAIGTIPFLLALFAVCKRRETGNGKLVGWFAFLWVVTLSLSLRLPISYLPFHLNLPFFATGISNRILFLPAFCTSVLAAYGLAMLRQQKGKVTWIVLLFIPILVSVSVWWFSPTDEIPNMRRDWLVIARRNVIVPGGITVAAFATTLLYWQRSRVVLTALLALSLMQLYYGFGKFMPFADRRFFYPSHPLFNKLSELTAHSYERFWGYGGSTFDYSGAYIENNLATAFGLYAAEGYDSLHDHRYGQLLFTSSNGQVQTQLSRSDAVLERAPDANVPLTAQTNRLRLLELLGVRYILDREEEAPRVSYQDPKRFNHEMFSKVWQEGTWRIFEFKKARPRAWLVGEVYVARFDQEIVDKLLTPTFDLSHIAVIERPLTAPASGVVAPTVERSASSSARVTMYQANRVGVDTSSDKAQLLVLSDTYYPGWKAFIDGEETVVYRTNFALRGVVVPGGSHTVVFSYEPQSFEKGKEYTALGAILFAAFWLSWRKHTIT